MELSLMLSCRTDWAVDPALIYNFLPPFDERGTRR